MITNCEECGDEVEFDLVEQCFICGADGLCPNCLDSHLCGDDYDDE